MKDSIRNTTNGPLSGALPKIVLYLEHSLILRICTWLALILERWAKGSFFLKIFRPKMKPSWEGGSLLFALLFFLGAKLKAPAVRIFAALEKSFAYSITAKLSGCLAVFGPSSFLRPAFRGSLVVRCGDTRGKVQHTNKVTFTKAHIFLIMAAVLLLGAGFCFFPAVKVLKYTLAAAAAGLVLYNTTWGLCLLAGTLPLLPNLSLLLLAGLVALSFIFARLRSRDLGLQPAVPGPVVVFMIAIAVFTLISVTPAGSMRDFGTHLLSFGLFIVLINQLKSKNALHAFLLCALAAAFVVSLYGIYQFVIGVPVESAWVDAAQHPTLRTRAYSFFGNPNVLSEYLIMLIPFGLALAWSARDYRKKALLLALTGSLALSLVFTFSRGGWMGFAIGLFLFFLLREKRIFVFMLLLLLVLLLAGAAFMPDTVLQRIATIGSTRDTSNLYRFQVWREALLIIKDFWATGVGFGYLAFRKIYPYYMLSRTKLPFHVHSTYLQFLVEMGVGGFLVFVWFIVDIFKKGLQRLSAGGDEFSRNIIIASLSATAALLTQGLVEHVLYMPKIIMLFWIVIAFVFHKDASTSASPPGHL